MAKIEPDLRWKETSSILFPGISDDILVSRIKFSARPLRSTPLDSENLVMSIAKKGLLHPILVRITEKDDYEVVAGNRRLYACRILKWKKIPVHVVELDDKQAFEVSLAENINRRTLTPLEEAGAFKSYVMDNGWGSITDLAEQLGKSVSYVAKRIKLLELPQDVQSALLEKTLSTSAAEELLFVKNSEEQSKLAELVKRRCLTSKKLRKGIKEDEFMDYDYTAAVDDDDYSPSETIEQGRKSLDKSITVLRIAMSRMGAIVEGSNEDWIVREILMQHKHMLHTQIDTLMKEKTKISKKVYRW